MNIDDGLRDIVAMGFDAGIRLGESVERDMIADVYGGTFEGRAGASTKMQMADHSL